MTAICFYNNGTFDKRAFTMMGLSAKKDDKAIGFFGTGFKYAIASLLRQGCTVRVVTRGDDTCETEHATSNMTYDFHAAPGNFRGKEQNFVYCTSSCEDDDNEQVFELPFTTHLGANWKLWQAYRELYTNAKDEGGGVMLVNGSKSLHPGDVNVYVTGDDFVDVYQQHDKYFLTAQPLATSPNMRCLEKQPDHDNVVYYKTMYTGTKLDKASYFTYDYITTQQLTEDRTLMDTWYLRSHISDLWQCHMSFEMLIEHLPRVAHEVYYEHSLASNPSFETPSEDFIRACRYLIEHHKPLPMWARDAYATTRPFDEQVDELKLTKFQKKQLARAVAVLKHHNIMVDENIITTAVSLPEDVAGLYRNKRIYIAKCAFERGFTSILGTLYEEHLHHAEGVEDMSRRMQNLLIDKCALLMEQVYVTDHEVE